MDMGGKKCPASCPIMCPVGLIPCPSVNDPSGCPGPQTCVMDFNLCPKQNGCGFRLDLELKENVCIATDDSINK
jgi:hypothetical protein